MRPISRRGALAAAALPLFARAARADDVTVFAAASLTDVLKELGGQWAARGHATPRFSFAASSTLARQIEAGAQAEIFASADENWADYLQTRNLLQNDSRVRELGNTLVLIAPASSPAGDVPFTAAGFDARLGPDGRFAVGDPAGVPAGIYAQAALTRLGLWTGLQPRLAKADSVRSALMLVGRGEAPLGIVYATDAAITKDVRVVGSVPAGSYDAISYPFALTKTGTSADARALFAFLTGPDAAPAYRKYGFSVRD